MAWDQSDFCGKEVMIGDKPLDAFGLALSKISVEYQERYDRKPTVAEVLYALKIVMVSNVNNYFFDPQMLGSMVISLGGSQSDS